MVHTTAGQVMEPKYHDEDTGQDINTTRSVSSDHDNIAMDMTLATLSDTNPNMDLTTDPFADDVSQDTNDECPD